MAVQARGFRCFPPKAYAVVADFKGKLLLVQGKRDAYMARLGMAHDVRQPFLHGTVGDKRLVDPVAAFVDRIAKLSQRIEAGDSRLYIVYIVVALVALLIATVALMGGAA